MDIVTLYFRVERCCVQPQQSGGAGLVTAGLVEGAADKVDLEAFYFVIEIYAAGEVDVTGDAFGIGDHFEGKFRIANLGA